MKRSLKKALAGILVATMLVGTSAISFAAEEGGTSGSGELEGTVVTDIFTVVLPTVLDEGDETFDFILDPEGLIAATASARYPDMDFEEDATVFFNNIAEGATNDYSSTSDALTVTNKSTSEVAITLTASVSGVEGITMTEDNTFAEDTKASLYLALTDGIKTSAIGSEESAKITETVAEAGPDAYEIKWNDGEDKYEYVLTDAANADEYEGFETYSFQLTGDCNTAGDWSELTTAVPSVEVTWSIADPFVELEPEEPEPEDAAPSIATKSYVMGADTAVTVNVDLGTGDLAATGIESIGYKSSSGEDRTLADTNYTYADSTLTINSTHVNSLLAVPDFTERELSINFNDTAKTIVKITLTK